MADNVRSGQQRTIYLGTELKFALTITSEGFSMITDDFKVVIKSTKKRKEVVITKDEMMLDENDKYLFTIDTEELGIGEYWIYVYAYVPDDDFPDGLRTEVQKQQLCTVMS